MTVEIEMIVDRSMNGCEFLKDLSSRNYLPQIEETSRFLATHIELSSRSCFEPESLDSGRRTGFLFHSLFRDFSSLILVFEFPVIPGREIRF